MKPKGLKVMKILTLGVSPALKMRFASDFLKTRMAGLVPLSPGNNVPLCGLTCVSGWKVGES